MSLRQPGATDRARVTTFVAVEPLDAFEVFTQETDLWWKKGPRFRFGGARNGVLRFEGRAGGRLLEVFDDATGDAYEVGRVLVWEPGERLVFEWRARAFMPGEVTEVEVRFEPVSGGTRVVLEHRGWEAVAPTHPVRHGLEAPEFLAWMGRWWGELATSFRLHAAKARG